MFDDHDLQQLFKIDPAEDSALTHLEISTQEIVARALQQWSNTRTPRRGLRAVMVVAATLVIAVPLSWSVLRGTSSSTESRFAVSVQCFRGEIESSPVQTRPLKGTLELTCSTSAPGDHGASRGQFACVRISGQVAVFTRRHIKSSTSCESMGLPPFIGDIQRPNQLRLLRDVRSIQGSHACLSLQRVKFSIAQLLGQTGSGGWRITGEPQSACVQVVVQLHNHLFLLIKRA